MVQNETWFNYQISNQISNQVSNQVSNQIAHLYTLHIVRLCSAWLFLLGMHYNMLDNMISNLAVFKIFMSVCIPIVHSIDQVLVGQSQLKNSIFFRQFLKSHLKMSKRIASKINDDPAKKSWKYFSIEYKLKLLKEV